MTKNIKIGLGLVSIGRKWGFRETIPPAEEVAIQLIRTAAQSGIDFFDTAPAYGSSETILGNFMSLYPSEAKNITISTKMGEVWDANQEIGIEDHSYDGLCKSIDKSLALLGRIDILLVHKATAENLKSEPVLKAIEYAQSLGISKFGASIKSFDAAQAACENEVFSYIQFPYNKLYPGLRTVFPLAKKHGKTPIVNRPLAMGQLLHQAVNKKQAIQDAFNFVSEELESGIIIFGTRSENNLKENLSVLLN